MSPLKNINFGTELNVERLNTDVEVVVYFMKFPLRQLMLAASSVSKGGAASHQGADDLFTAKAIHRV